MDPLATLADLAARTIAVPDPAVATTFLEVASAAVREAAGVPISRVTSMVQVYGTPGSPWLRLPGGPVASVTSVTLDDRTLVAGTDYVRIGEYLYRPCGWTSRRPLPAPVTVLYSHGLAEVPADIIDLVCRMTAGALALVAEEDGGAALAVDRIAAESLGDYSVTYDRSSGTTEMELSDQTRERLAARFGGGAAAVPTVPTF